MGLFHYAGNHVTTKPPISSDLGYGLVNGQVLSNHVFTSH